MSFLDFPNRCGCTVLTPAPSLHQFLRYIGHQGTSVLDREFPNVGDAVLVLVTKSFFFSEFRGEHKVQRLKLVPIMVIREVDEVLIDRRPSFDRAGGNHIDITVVQSFALGIAPVRPIAAQMIASACPDPGCGMEGKFLPPALGGVYQAYRPAFEAGGEELARRSRRNPCGNRKIVSSPRQCRCGEGIPRDAIRVQQQRKRDVRVGHRRAGVEPLEGRDSPGRIHLMTRQPSFGAPIGEQTAGRAL